MNAIRINIADKNTLIERYGHICVVYGDRYLIVFAGHNYDSMNDRFNIDNLNRIWIFDTLYEKWKSYPTKGDSPKRLSGSCGLLYEHYLYIFGGFAYGRHTNKICKLNLKTFEWTNCTPNNCKSPSPRDKFSGWVVDNKLYYFGGFGVPIVSSYLNECGNFHIDESTFVDDGPPLGWNNQLVCFDTTTNTWQNPVYTSDSVPLPRAAHSCVYISDYKVVLFGGRVFSARTNDLYILDLKTFKWSANLNTLTNQNPVGRSWMTMVKLNNDDLIMHGGFIGGNDALGDTWLLNLKNLTWTELKIKNMENRLWHTANVVNKTKQIYIFGGCSKSFTEYRPELPKHLLKVLIYPDNLQETCLNFICSNYYLYKPIIENSIILPKDLKNLIQRKLDFLDETNN